MHASSYENMIKCFRRHVAPIDFGTQKVIEVLDIGGADVNGSYRSIFSDAKFRYRIADLEAGAGVDIVLTDPYSLPLEDGSIDIVVSGQAFEHIEFFWKTFENMVRVLKPDGTIILIAPSGGPEHRYPVDCYRFYPDAFSALAKHANCDLVDIWRDERGPWRDLVGVFRHAGASRIEKKLPTLPKPLPGWTGPTGSPEEEAAGGKAPYLDVLSRFHQTLRPSTYLEIGVRHGRSLALATGKAIGVDPAPEIDVSLPPGATVIARESDEFFDEGMLAAAPDLAFIDGLHLFEFALRDFMNIERAAVPGSVLIIDDIFPNHPAQAERERRTNHWTGDVWKVVEVLRTHRPDLYVSTIDINPTGLALVAGLDPSNRVLWDQYNPIVRHFKAVGMPPPHVLARQNALDPLGEPFDAVLNTLADNRRHQRGPRDAARALRDAVGSRHSIPLSIVVVAFNMSRELPRTIKSLSPRLQRGIEASDYEIIVVDNGSAEPVDEAELRRLAGNLKVIRMQNAAVSPVPAIQAGLEAARGELVGVFIDGARMASPGLLANALAASRVHERPVIGTIAFHLGPKVQAESAREGYDQGVEDALLASVRWEEDGYRLFDISALAGSSADGWYVVPAESNAVFMRADHWRALGGYDARFASPGGGLANLDLWARACADPAARLIMLLGEATFHQIHGGVTTQARPSTWPEFHAEYQRIRGKPFQRPTRQPYYFGTLPGSAGAAPPSSGKVVASPEGLAHAKET